MNNIHHINGGGAENSKFRSKLSIWFRYLRRTGRPADGGGR